MLRRAVNVLISEGASRASLRSAFALPDKEIEQLSGLDSGYFKSAEVHQLAVSKKSPLRITDMESGEVVEFTGAKKRT
jgi:hypothetical protein